MDKTPEYIKMSEMAKEVQEQWDLEDDANYVAEIFDDYAMTEVYMGYFINSSIQILKANNQGQQYVWLPRIDQLQEMIPEKWTMTFHLFCKEMTYEAGGQYFYGSLYERSMEQVWLMFVMKHNHNKVWNGEDWVKA